jgi:hypothetical protein
MMTVMFSFTERISIFNHEKKKSFLFNLRFCIAPSSVAVAANVLSYIQSKPEQVTEKHSDPQAEMKSLPVR